MINRRLILFSIGLIGFATYFAISQRTVPTNYAITIQPAQITDEPNSSSTQILFSHGYVRNTYGIGKKQMQRFVKNGICAESNSWFFEYNDTDQRTNLAQSLDCQCLHDAYQQVTATDNDCVLIGLSRGGSTALLFTAQHKPTHVKALIVESPFAHVDDVAYRLGVQYVPWAPFKKQIALWVMRYLFPLFDPKHTAPIDVVDSIDHTIPLLFICSQKDDLIPAASTLQLVEALRNAGHPHVYAIVLPEGEHGYLSYNEDVQHVTNAFLAHYNLQHNTELAQAGREGLTQCYQPPYKRDIGTL